MIRTYRIALCSALVSWAMLGAACKKEAAPAAAQAAQGSSEAKPTADKPADSPADKPAVAPAATLAGGGNAPVPASPPSPAAEAAAGSNTQLQNEGLAMMTKLAELFAADAKDCEKLATDIKGFGAQNKELMAKLSTMEKGLGEQESAAFEQRNQAAIKVVMDKMTPAMTACRGNKNVEAAMKELPTDN
jgi:hypothetical protein